MKIETSLHTYQQHAEHERLHIYLDEKAACEVRTNENHEPMVDLRTYTETPLLFHKSLPTPLVREGLAKRIVLAATYLEEKGFLLEIVELHRSIEKQQREFDEISTHMKQNHPNLNEEQLWAMTTQFIADPKLCPPHTTGGACDVQLRYTDHTLVDMGCPINSITAEAALMYEHLHPQAKEHRELLLNAFLKAGCAPMASEWWHFSYGEKYWGAFYNCDAVYDVVLV